MKVIRRCTYCSGTGLLLVPSKLKLASVKCPVCDGTGKKVVEEADDTAWAVTR